MLNKPAFKPTFPPLNSHGLDSTELQGEENTDFSLAALGVISIGDAFFDSCELTLFLL